MTRASFAAALLALAACKGARSSGGRDAGPEVAVGAPTDAAAAAPVTCRAPETLVLDEVEVRQRGLADDPALDSHELGRRLARCLIEREHAVALERQVPPGREPRPARLTIDVGAERPDGAAQVKVVMAAQLAFAEGAGPGPTASVAGDAPVRDDVAAALVAVSHSLEQAVCADLGARIELWAADDLRPALTGTDPATALWALQLAAARPPGPGLLDAIVPWLDRDAALRDAAIAALVAQQDPRAVAPLTAITDLSDRATLVRIIEAVRTLGGDDARDFLHVMASHRDPTIADLARGHAPGSQAAGSPP